MTTALTSLTRSELYKAVWSKPLTKLAKQYGVSDVAIGRICKRWNIPKPGVGYWQKLKAGQDVTPEPLSKLDNETDAKIIISPRTHRIEDSPEEAGEALAIPVPKRLTSPHELICKTKELFSERKTADYGFLYSQKPYLDIRVTPSSLPRALRVMDTLIKALEERGHRVNLIDEYGDKTVAVIKGHNVAFGIEERQKQIRSPEGTIMGLQPTNRLVLVDKAPWARDLKRNWADGKRKKVEDFLGDFILSLEAHAEVIAREKLERKRQEEIWEQERLRHAREEQRKELLDEVLDRWRRANQYYQLIEALEKSSTDLLQKTPCLDWWLNWARDYVSNIDPTTDFEWASKISEQELFDIKSSSQHSWLLLSR